MPRPSLIKQYKDPKIAINEILKRINAQLNNYDEFIEYCKKRGLFDDESSFKKIAFTRANIIKLYREFVNPIKQTSAILGFSYRELANNIGYSEHTLSNVANKSKVSEPIKKSLALLLKNYELEKELQEQKKSFSLALKSLYS